MSEAENKSALNDALSAAAKNSALGKVSTADALNGPAIVAAIGGVRGLIESIVPSFFFLVVYLISKDVLISSLVPVVLAVIFVIVRVVQKKPVAPAITGAVIVAVTAVLAISTGRVENNFIFGIVLNAVYLVAMLVSIIARRPLVGVVVALLMENAKGWRENPLEFRALTLATWLWTGMFTLRVIIEVPLYLASNAAALAVAKLILGVPLYAVVLWLTWLLVRTAFPPKPAPVAAE